MDKTIQYRTAKISRRGIDEASRTVELSFASEEPAERYFGAEILDCTPGAVNLDRLNGGGNLLMDHDPRDVVAVCESARVDSDRICRAIVKFGKGTRATEVFGDVVDGIRRSVSVGYLVHDLVLESKEGDKQVYRVTKWEPLEISLASVPLDAKVGVGRSSTSQFKNQIKAMENPTEERTVREMTKTDRERHADKIRELAKHFLSSKTFEGRFPFEIEIEAERCIALQMTGDEFQRHCVKHAFNAGPLQTPDSERLTGDPINRSFGNTATAGTLGKRLLGHDDFQKFVRQSGKKYVSVDFPDLLSLRAALTISGNGISTINQTEMLVLAPTEKLTIADLYSQGQTNATVVRYLVEAAFVNTVAAVAEAGAKPELSLSLTPADSPVRKLAGYVRISQEMLEDIGAAEMYVNMRLRNSVEEMEELQLLAGDGLGQNLTGILSTSGILTQAKGADTVPDCIRKAMTKIQVTAKMAPTGIVLHPNDFEEISLLKDAQNRYLIGDIFSLNEMGTLTRSPSIWGLPIVVTTSMTENTAIVGAFKPAAWLWRRTGITVSASNSDGNNFTTNMVTILAEERLAAGIVKPSAFCTCTGI